MKTTSRTAAPLLAALVWLAMPGLATAQTIPEVAAKAGSFKTLLTAAKAAGLVPALSGRGPLTVFAPTDDAFAKLPRGTVEGLLEPRNKSKLAAILKYHVVAGRAIRAGQIKAGRTHLKTLNGKQVAVVKNGGVTVNGARVVTADVKASNGVIHVIDRVLIPK
jgi:uncharacterized surface protein with fasciclin (FAS1) repeats